MTPEPKTPFRILARHEIGQTEIEQMKQWQSELNRMCKNTNRAGTTMVHFKIELKRVNRWLRNIEI